MSWDMTLSLRSSWRVMEGRDYYVPDYLAGDSARSRPDLHAAADNHARDLREAGQHLDASLNLLGTLRAAVGEAGDTRAMQVDTVLKIVENLLGEARAAIDRHDSRFLNLFIAYFDRDGAPAAPGN